MLILHALPNIIMVQLGMLIVIHITIKTGIETRFVENGKIYQGTGPPKWDIFMSLSIL